MSLFLSSLRPITLLYGKIAVAIVFLLEVVDLINSDGWRDVLYSDHGIIEGCVIAIALASAFFAGKAIFQHSTSAWLCYAPLFGLNIFLFLEEVSFGQDILGFQSFKLGGVYFNAVHDIFSMLYKHLGTYILILMVLGIVLVVKNYRRLIAPVLQNYPPYRFAFICLVLLGLSILFDLNMIYHPPSEEYLEMLGMLAVLFGHVDVNQQLKRARLSATAVESPEQVYKTVNR